MYVCLRTYVVICIVPIAVTCGSSIAFVTVLNNMKYALPSSSVIVRLTMSMTSVIIRLLYNYLYKLYIYILGFYYIYIYITPPPLTDHALVTVYSWQVTRLRYCI